MFEVCGEYLMCVNEDTFMPQSTEGRGQLSAPGFPFHCGFLGSNLDHQAYVTTNSFTQEPSLQAPLGVFGFHQTVWKILTYVMFDILSNLRFYNSSNLESCLFNISITGFFVIL